jgi:hypothetical protein
MKGYTSMNTTPFDAPPVIEKDYGDFTIEWYGKTIDKQIEHIAVNSIRSLRPKLLKYTEFIRREAESGALIAIEVYIPEGLSLDLFYDEKMKAFGLRIRNLSEQIADVRFPRDVVI